MLRQTRTIRLFIVLKTTAHDYLASTGLETLTKQPMLHISANLMYEAVPSAHSTSYKDLVLQLSHWKRLVQA